jgi:hypothetical protein
MTSVQAALQAGPFDPFADEPARVTCHGVACTPAPGVQFELLL